MPQEMTANKAYNLIKRAYGKAWLRARDAAGGIGQW